MSPRRRALGGEPHLRALPHHHHRHLVPDLYFGNETRQVDFLNMLLTVTVSRRAPQPALEFAQALSGADHAPAFLDRWRPWLALTAILIVIAYGPTLVRLAATTPLNMPGLRVW